MTDEEYERGLELQGYKKSIADMTLGDIALKFLKKHHLPKFLKTILVKFAHPLLLLKDIDLDKAKDLIEDMYDQIPASHSDYYKDVMNRARQFLWSEEND